jgi:hypothetical protein
MNDLIRLALALATAGDKPRTCRATARFVGAAAACVAAGACAVAALACALAAIWIFARPHVGAAGAWAIVTGILLAKSLALLALSRYCLKPRPTPPAGADVPLLVTEATRLVRDNKAPVLLAALLAGLIAGRGER